MKSVRSKVLVVVILMVMGLGAAILLISRGIYEQYKELKISQCRSLVDLAGERVNKDIRQLEENAKTLAQVGYLYYKGKDAASAQRVLKSYYQPGAVAIGGGIWFEPHKIDPAKKRACFYAFNENGTVKIDPGFETEKYDYLSQNWYVTIQRALKGPGTVAWTTPYFDEQGTLTLMTTIGAGVYDEQGNFVGMSTMDWALDAIAESIAQIKPTVGSFALFADQSSGFILALSDKNFTGDARGKSLKDVAWFDTARGSEALIHYAGTDYFSFKRTLDNAMTIVVNVPRAELFADIEESLRHTLVALALACLVMMLATFFLLNKLVNRPIAYLSQKAARLGEGDFDTEIRLDTRDELGSLAQCLNQMARDIKEHVQSDLGITAQKERIATELGVAQKIQASILPSIFPPYPQRAEFNIYATMQPAKEVGGDFFDFFLIDENRLALVIADVSDKGVPAALFMMIAKTLIKNFAMLGLDVCEVFERANRQLCENNKVDMFVTAFMGVLDVRDGKFSYVNAGHNPPCLSRAGKPFEELSLPAGFVLGGMEQTRYVCKETTLEIGDRLFLFTDGVTEAFDSAGEPYGEDRLMAALNAHRSEDIRLLLDDVNRSVRAFTAGAYQSDDITMLGMVYYGP